MRSHYASDERAPRRAHSALYAGLVAPVTVPALMATRPTLPEPDAPSGPHVQVPPMAPVALMRFAPSVAVLATMRIPPPAPPPPPPIPHPPPHEFTPLPPTNPCEVTLPVTDKAFASTMTIPPPLPPPPGHPPSSS